MFLAKHHPVTPSAISNLELWLDANDPSTFTLNAGKVSNWADKSGNGNDYPQGTAASQPPYIDGASGQKLVDFTFDGSENHLIGPFTSALNIVNSDYEFFFVWKSPVLTVRSYFYSVLGSSFLSGLDAFGNYEHLPKGGLTKALLLGAFDDTIMHCSSSRVESDVSKVRVDRVDGGTTATPARSSTNNDTWIGLYRGAVGRWAGQIAEILLYSRALSVPERDAVEISLMNKWGIPV